MIRLQHHIYLHLFSQMLYQESFLNHAPRRPSFEFRIRFLLRGFFYTFQRHQRTCKSSQDLDLESPPSILSIKLRTRTPADLRRVTGPPPGIESRMSMRSKRSTWLKVPTAWVQHTINGLRYPQQGQDIRFFEGHIFDGHIIDGHIFDQ